MRGAVILVVLVAASASDAAKSKEAAFGFSKGMTLKEAKAAAHLTRVPSAPNYYVTKRAPLSVHPFSGYGLIIGKTTGVCGVLAQTDHMPKDSKAFSDTAASVMQLLNGRYGLPSLTSETETSRTVKWPNAQGPETSIELTVQHADDGTVYIQAHYQFSNLKACSRELTEGL